MLHIKVQVGAKCVGLGCIAKGPRNDEISLESRVGTRTCWVYSSGCETKALEEVIVGLDSWSDLSGTMPGEEW